MGQGPDSRRHKDTTKISTTVVPDLVNSLKCSSTLRIEVGTDIDVNTIHPGDSSVAFGDRL